MLFFPFWVNQATTPKLPDPHVDNIALLKPTCSKFKLSSTERTTMVARLVLEEAEEAEEVILKANNDKREYRRVVLDNSLEVLLISDPDTDKCAASMNAEVGSFSDPPGLEGLAHFVEHMLFYASEKYPSENGFSKYITEHGGVSNAFTSAENTNYNFDVNVDSFEEALDRFAQFFIKPLMSEDAITREINAVDSEYQKNRLSDFSRLSQIQKHLSEASHPYHKFSTGNNDTLEICPKANGIDIRREVIKFYEENYSANLMHLVVYGKDSLDTIQKTVEEKFQNIRNTARSCYSFPIHPCSSEHLQILIRVVPVRDNHTLKVQWPITPTVCYYKEVPCDYLSDLIGHEGEGTLFHVLKKLGWATSLSAGSNEYSDFAFFVVSIDLTDAGHEHMQDVVGLLFKYIRLVRETGICKWIFDERSALSETMFHHRDKSSPYNYVISIAENMKDYPPKDWLVRSSLPSNFSPTIIEMILEELSLTNCRIFFMSKKFEGHNDMIEPWYGTAFSVEKLIDSTIKKWMLAAPKENLSLPVPNPFIPSNLSLKNIEKKKVEFPMLLRKAPFSVLWYKPDTVFSVPKASVKIKFHCPNACSSPEAAVLMGIFTSLLNDYLNEYGFYADLAGLYYGIGCTDSGFRVSVSGYNHKLRILLETVLDNVAKFEVKPDRFSVIKEKLIKNHRNFKFWEPRSHASYYCSLILNDRVWPLTEQLEILTSVKEEDLSHFVPIMLSRCFIECYVAGNVEADEAESMMKHVEYIFFRCPRPICRPLFPSQYLTNRVVELKEGKPYFYSIPALNPEDENSALIHYIQVHQDDFKMNARLQLIALIAQQEAFQQLRTVEQLGYITSLRLRSDSDVYGLQFVIQSTSKSPKHIDSRVEAFLKMFENKLHDMKGDDFKGKVTALIDLKLEKFKNLWEETGFYWKEISNGTLKFDRDEREVEELRKLTQHELIDFFDEYIKVGAPKKRALSVRIYGARHSSEFAAAEEEEEEGNGTVDEPNNSVYRIDDILSFRRSLPLYGSFGGCFDQVKPYRI